MPTQRFISMLLLTCLLLAPMTARAEEELLIGLIPEENIFRQIKKHKPLGEYLMQRLGIKVRFTILSRYPEIIKRFVDRELDGAFFGIFTAVLAEERLGVSLSAGSRAEGPGRPAGAGSNLQRPHVRG